MLIFIIQWMSISRLQGKMFAFNNATNSFQTSAFKLRIKYYDYDKIVPDANYVKNSGGDVMTC